MFLSAFNFLFYSLRKSLLRFLRLGPKGIRELTQEVVHRRLYEHKDTHILEVRTKLGRKDEGIEQLLKNTNIHSLSLSKVIWVSSFFFLLLLTCRWSFVCPQPPPIVEVLVCSFGFKSGGTRLSLSSLSVFAHPVSKAKLWLIGYLPAKKKESLGQYCWSSSFSRLFTRTYACSRTCWPLHN